MEFMMLDAIFNFQTFSQQTFHIVEEWLYSSKCPGKPFQWASTHNNQILNLETFIELIPVIIDVIIDTSKCLYLSIAY